MNKVRHINLYCFRNGGFWSIPFAAMSDDMAVLAVKRLGADNNLKRLSTYRVGSYCTSNGRIDSYRPVLCRVRKNKEIKNEVSVA